MSSSECTNAPIDMHQCLHLDAPMPALRCTDACVKMHQCLRWDAPIPLLKWNTCLIFFLKKGRDCEANEGEKVKKKQGKFGDCLKYRIPEHRRILFWLSMVMAFMFFLGCSLSTCCMASRFFGKPDRRKMEETWFLNQWMHPNYSNQWARFILQSHDFPVNLLTFFLNLAKGVMGEDPLRC